MTFEEYWEIKVRANAGLKDEEATMKITVESFKRQMRQAFLARPNAAPNRDILDALKKAMGK